MRFIDNGNHTITDMTTGLIWQKFGPDKLMTWDDAIKYAASLGDGWRLPTIEELFMLADHSLYNPSIAPAFQCYSYNYWSSSTYVNYPAYAWDVNFNNGDAYWYNKTNDNYVRCVRSKEEINA